MADGGNTGGGGAGSRRSLRSRDLNPLLVAADIGGEGDLVNPGAADHHDQVDDEENVYGNLGDLAVFYPNPTVLVNQNVAADIGGGGNLDNPADPLNAFDQGNPGGSEVVVGAAPVVEGAPQNQGRRRARQNPRPPQQQRRIRARRQPAQNHPPPQPQGPIEYRIPDMGEIPAHLRDPPHRLYQLCRKKLTNSDMKTLNISGHNRPFLKHMAEQAGIALRPGSGPGLRVNVQVLNNPAPLIGTTLYLRNTGGDALTLAWRDLFSSMDCRLAAEQYIDMWFEMAPPSMNIYIQGR